jgi:hypothetical protein
MNHLWDFDENINYININGFKVLDLPDAVRASLLLRSIKNLILQCFESIKINEMITPEIELLITTPFVLQEMQLKKDQLIYKFEGLNKPKNVRVTNKDEIGPDKNLRADYRHIFLDLRADYNGRLKTIESLKPLIAHELTHTALNHVRWRDDDHDKNFMLYYNIILRNLHFNRTRDNSTLSNSAPGNYTMSNFRF